MPFLVLNGTTIPVVAEPVDAEVTTYGDTAEAWDGTYLTRRRGTKRTWTVTTPWLTTAEASPVLAALNAAPPTTASGDLTGSLQVIVTIQARRTHTIGTIRRFAFDFTLREA